MLKVFEQLEAMRLRKATAAGEAASEPETTRKRRTGDELTLGLWTSTAHRSTDAVSALRAEPGLGPCTKLGSRFPYFQWSCLSIFQRSSVLIQGGVRKALICLVICGVVACRVCSGVILYDFHLWTTEH